MCRADLFAVLRRDFRVHAWLRLQREALGSLRYQLLREVQARPRVDITTLACRLGRARSTVSEAVAGLARDGYLNVFDDDADLRRRLVELSADGERYLTPSRARLAKRLRTAERRLLEVERRVSETELLAAETAIELYYRDGRSQAQLAAELGVGYKALDSALSVLVNRQLARLGRGGAPSRIPALTEDGCARVERAFWRDALRGTPEGAAAGAPWQGRATPQRCGGPLAAEVLPAIAKVRQPTVTDLSNSLSLSPALVETALDALVAGRLVVGPPGRSGSSRWVELLSDGKALLGERDADDEDRQEALRLLRVHIARPHEGLDASLAAYAMQVMYFWAPSDDPTLEEALALSTISAQAAVSFLRSNRYLYTVGRRFGLSDLGVGAVEAYYVRRWLHGRAPVSRAADSTKIASG